jgi:uncharacterized protein YhdP
MKQMRASLRWFAWLLSRSALLLLMLLALYSGAGRLLMPMLDAQRHLVEAELSRLIGARVTIGSLKGAWFRLSPVIDVHNLAIAFADPSDVQAGTSGSHLLRSLAVQLDVPASLWRRDWVIAAVTIDTLDLTLQEDGSGAWSVAGMAAGGANYTNIINFVLNIARLDLLDTSITLQRANGSLIQFQEAALALRNRAQTHSLELLVSQQGLTSPAVFQVEVHGDPTRQFTGLAYANLNNVNFREFIPRLRRGFWQPEELRGNAEIWATFNNGGLQQLHANLDEVDIGGHLEETDELLDIDNLTLSLALIRESADAWRLWIDNLGFHWENVSWQPSQVYATLDQSTERGELELVIDQLNLSLLSDLALASGALPPAMEQVLASLKPGGEIINARFNTWLSGEFPGLFALRANLADVAVNAWSTAPAGRGINGYLQTSALGG